MIVEDLFRHVSEVLRGWKAPSPEAAARIAQVLGADDDTIRRARRRAEDLREWKRENTQGRSRKQGHRSGQGTAGLPLHYQLGNPAVDVSIITGDLFNQDTHLAVSFSDTSTVNDRIIDSSSVQGQLLRLLFAGDEQLLDQQLAVALATVAPVRVESRQDKPLGKLVRYPLGTVAVLGEPRRLIFAIAFGRMGNDLVVRAPVESLWACYSQLWEAVYRHGQRRVLSIPLMGSGLSRVDTLDHDNLLQLILLSFVAYSRLRIICRELRIVIAPGDVGRIDTAALHGFLRSL